MAAATGQKELDLEHRLVMPDGRIKYLHVVGKAESGETRDIEVIGAVGCHHAEADRNRTTRSKEHLADAQRLKSHR